MKADLYKLNIYAPGGFCKAHVDTPHWQKGCLVCLSTQSTGGELIACHHKEEIKHDWSQIH